MFCQYCGKPVPEGETVCADCAAKKQQAQFVLNTAPQQPKKSKAPLIIGIVAIVAVLCVVAVLLLPKLFKPATPQAQLVSIEENLWEQHIDELSDAYGSYLEQVNATQANGKLGLSLKVDDSVLSSLESALAQGNMPLELSWLQEINLDMLARVKDDQLQMILDLGLQKKSIAQLDVLADMENWSFKAGLPGLQKSYLGLNFTDLVPEIDKNELQTQYNKQRQLQKQLFAQLPDQERVNAMLKAYVKLVLSHIQTVESVQETVKCDAISQELTVLKATITEEELRNICIAVLEQIKTDSVVLDFLKAVETYARGTAPEYEAQHMPDLIKEFTQQIEDTLEELRQVECSPENYLIVSTYVDDKDAVMGRKLEMFSQDDEDEFATYYITLWSKDAFTFEAQLQQLHVTGIGNKKNDTVIGTYVLEVEGRKYLSVDVEYPADAQKENHISGKLRLRPAKALLDEMADPGSSAASILQGANFALELAMEGKDDAGSFRVSLVSGEKALLSLILDASQEEKTEITQPKDVTTVTGQMDLMQWVMGVDFQALMNNMRQAGVPDDYVKLFAGMLFGTGME